ncbi:hypothetical protein DNK49_10530 [Azoarcus communis]|uniref:Uncharacterized protein n=1 Tax=Parazoarcus communis SWub3 = DSM 12120 TaxID=1121029 RepID=A0A323UVU6_9RHOO|nr:hypothetical protein DNK49_10530 [Azoarcus communis] [Parazoarcus communis SWub3 = DSM 12120]
MQAPRCVGSALDVSVRPVAAGSVPICKFRTGSGATLIADDLFINCDDRRTAAGLNVLGRQCSTPPILLSQRWRSITSSLPMGPNRSVLSG